MESCDTFVVMSDLTAPGDVIFGKNSDRPVGEVQEVVRIQSKNHEPNSNVHVSTYILFKLHSNTFFMLTYLQSYECATLIESIKSRS